MITEISQEIRNIINNYTSEDQLIFNNKLLKIDRKHFQQIGKNSGKSITFIDGGQAEILSSGNFCLSFIRIFAQTFRDNNKERSYKKEFYLFTRAKWINNDLYYQSKLFGDKLYNEEILEISSNDQSIKTGSERAPISKIANMARRFAELSLAQNIESDFVVLDGTLEPTYKNEEKLISELKENVCALAKTSSLFTTSGNSPVILLNKIGPQQEWNYFIENQTYFVKLNEKAKHVFRFEGKKEILPYLIDNCSDALFLGYPYGLIVADKLARVSNAEKSSLKINFLLRKENKEIINYLNSSNAHEILDNLG
jgi:hypothetical protein